MITKVVEIRQEVLEDRLSDTFVLEEAHDAEEENYETLVLDTALELGTLETQVVQDDVTDAADADTNEKVIEEIDFMVPKQKWQSNYGRNRFF